MEKLRIREIMCKSILSHCGIEGIDYSVNPYLGCGHGCLYCYAKFMKRFHKGNEKWGEFVDVKLNALEKLRKEASSKSPGIVLLSSVTDPYQPVERLYRLTRGSLKILAESDFSVKVLTKSDLVLRDLDIIREMDGCEVGITFTSLDEKTRRVFEPEASTIEARLDVLKILYEAGVDTYAFLGPMLPFLSDETMESLLDMLMDRVNRVIVDRLNIKSNNWRNIQKALERYYPGIVNRFEEALSKESSYYNKLSKRVARMCKSRYLLGDILF
jgi:DNA repair photolyase